MNKIIAEGVVHEPKVVSIPGFGRVLISGSGAVITAQGYVDTYRVGDSLYWVAYLA